MSTVVCELLTQEQQLGKYVGFTKVFLSPNPFFDSLAIHIFHLTFTIIFYEFRINIGKSNTESISLRLMIKIFSFHFIQISESRAYSIL